MNNVGLRPLSPSSSASQKSWLIFLRKGESLMESGDSQLALVFLEEALTEAEIMERSDPRRIIIFDRLAEAAENVGDYKRAAGVINRSIAFKVKELGRFSLAALKDYRRLANVYEKDGLYSDSIKVYALVQKIEGRVAQSRRTMPANTQVPSSALVREPQKTLEKKLTAPPTLKHHSSFKVIARLRTQGQFLQLNCA